ncbi:Spx/MgsR family RNA polymerase-binding regulatory protein [Calothrix sp. 336/3]|uniref:Spx/MgsR family RNA polymerase-binding regulatory protein n=1 Tax=Calothrix sp. 336/3 TaxID=1337936 RepID=UPI000624B067|nr:Spx/MgsR family RNA polymerase-binding regulatory protein [Calothrix sp. 336/3]AKG23006.1 arsenate reductase [Calothrix sp. 336/3]
MSLKIYGIPTCSTCKKALQWVQSQGVVHEFINTKEQAPTSEMITSWVNSLGASALKNTSGLSYRSLGAEKKTWTDAQWITAFAEDAMLLKRPLFVKDGNAVMAGFKDKDMTIRDLHRMIDPMMRER